MPADSRARPSWAGLTRPPVPASPAPARVNTHQQAKANLAAGLSEFPATPGRTAPATQPPPPTFPPILLSPTGNAATSLPAGATRAGSPSGRLFRSRAARRERLHHSRACITAGNNQGRRSPTSSRLMGVEPRALR